MSEPSVLASIQKRICPDNNVMLLLQMIQIVMLNR